MEQFVIYTPPEHTFENYFFPLLKNTKWKFYWVFDDRVTIEDKINNQLVFLDFYGLEEPLDFSEYDPMEDRDAIERIKALINVEKVSVFSLLWNREGFAAKVSIEIFNDPKIVIDDNYGHVMKGSDYVDKLRENPDWFWNDRNRREK